MSGGEVVVPAQRRCFKTMERCQRRKSPLTPLLKRGVKKKRLGFEWSRKIYGVLRTRRVRTTLMGNDQLQRRARRFLKAAAGVSIKTIVTAALVYFVFVAYAAVVEAQTDFYKGKQMRIVVGASAGAASDLYARMVAQHLPKQIAGKPEIIV